MNSSGCVPFARRRWTLVNGTTICPAVGNVTYIVVVSRRMIMKDRSLTFAVIFCLWLLACVIFVLI